MLGVRDMKALAEHLEYLADRMNYMATASLSEIAKTIDELFGERIGKEQRTALAARYDRRSSPAVVLASPRTGAIFASAIVASPERLREVPRHNFHSLIIGDDDEG
jgi:hypothetical protein